MNEDTSKPNFSIREYHAGDEDAITQLFQRAYGHAITPVYWRWKIKGYPSEVENVFLATDNARIVFQYAGLPLQYKLNREIRTGMVGADAMTDPDYRRRGLLTRVSRHAFEVWRDAGVAFNIGLPNERWGSRKDALGWEPLFVLQWMVFPLRPEAIGARKTHLPFLRWFPFPGWVWRRFWQWKNRKNSLISIVPVTQVDDRFDHLWASIRDEFQFSVVRNRQWVEWRYVSCPSFPYQVAMAEKNGVPTGYMAYRLADEDRAVLGFIAEIVTAREDRASWRALANYALQKMESAGVETVFTQVPFPSWQSRLFQQRGFFRGQHGFQVRMVLFDNELSLTELKDPERWRMTGGDFDAI